MNTAILLAGGLGSRLQSVSAGLPKPLMSVGGRPFIEHVLDGLVAAGFERVVVAASYKWQLLQEQLGYSYLGCKLEWSIEDTPLGTGGAIRQAFTQFDLSTAFVLNADTLFRVDLLAMGAFHRSTGASVTVALRDVSDVARYGEVMIDENRRIVRFSEKSRSGRGLINGGVYVINDQVWRNHRISDPFSLERDFLNVRVVTEPVYGYSSDGYFIDIGVPEDLERARRDLSRG